MRLEDILKATLKNYQSWKSESLVNSLEGLDAIDKLFGESVLLLPSQVIYAPERINFVSFHHNLMVIDSQHKLIGMVNRVGTQWKKCGVLRERRPERPQAVDRTRNSIGERIFNDVSDYRCNSLLFTRRSVNSHMQVACKIITPPEGTPAKTWKNYLTPMGKIPAIGNFKVWKMNLRLPETNELNDDESMSSNAIIILDQECNFYGVYWHTVKDLTLCVDLSLSQPQKRLKYRR